MSTPQPAAASQNPAAFIETAMQAAQEFHQAGDWKKVAEKCEQVLQINPDYVAALIGLGLALFQFDKPEEAIEKYERALRNHPDSVEALVNLAGALSIMGRLDQAKNTVKQALRINPRCAEAHIVLGNIFRFQGETKNALTHYEMALQYAPHCTAGVYSNIGLALEDKGSPEEALEYYERALSYDPNFDDALWNKSHVSLKLGDYLEGWKLYEKSLGNPRLRGVSCFQTPAWNGKLNRKTKLLLWSEQGLGDSIQCIRYAALCKERVGKVSVLCPDSLVRLFKNCPFIDEVHSKLEHCIYDEHASIMSLPYIFGTTIDSIPSQIPYLFVSPEAREKWVLKFFTEPEAVRVGLVWAGNPAKERVIYKLRSEQKSVNLKKLLLPLQTPNVRFYSLQADETAQQIDRFKLRDRIVDFMGDVRDFMDTAALIQNLDLVITVDTSVAHLAGALGKPVWVLSRYNACWRWPRGRGTSPWYPTSRIFDQSTFGDWDTVIKNIRNALETASVSGNFSG